MELYSPNSTFHRVDFFPVSCDVVFDAMAQYRKYNLFTFNLNYFLVSTKIEKQAPSQFVAIVILDLYLKTVTRAHS